MSEGGEEERLAVHTKTFCYSLQSRGQGDKDTDMECAMALGRAEHTTAVWLITS
jgi:hypothetical protein